MKARAVADAREVAIFLLGALMGVVIALIYEPILGRPTNRTYEACVLEHLRDAPTRAAANLVAHACREIYPRVVDFTGR